MNTLTDQKLAAITAGAEYGKQNDGHPETREFFRLAFEAFTELKALRAQLASLPADWSKDSSLETWFPLSAEHIARLEAQLAELRGQEPDTYEWRYFNHGNGCFGPWVKLNGKRTFDKLSKRHADDNDYEFRVLYAHPVPQAASQPYAVPDEWRESLQEMVNAMRQYEMDVDECAPEKHRRMMRRADKLLNACRAAMLQNHFPGVRKMVSDNAAPQHKGGR